MRSPKIKNDDDTQQVSDKETAVILEELEQALRKASGDIVEFGCYRGDTSLLIEKFLEKGINDANNYINEKNRDENYGGFLKSAFWIYDSFEGLPQP